MMETRVYRVRLTSKGQVVIPKALRDKFRLEEGSLLRVIANDERMVLIPETDVPSRELRGLMKNEWSKRNLDELIKEAKRSLFKVQ
jgi:AbrB family looped-hinge helix DNA binding protein